MLDAVMWQDRLRELAGRHGVVGAALAVKQGDEQVEAVHGILNARTGQPVVPGAVFQIGSVTKVWTACLVMQLVDEGLVDLDAPVGAYLPDFRVADPAATETITARRLLSHSSGIDGDLFLDTGRGDDALRRYAEAMADLELVVPPGKVMAYANSGYSLLGHLVATLRQQPFEIVMRERLFAPLGLERAGMLPEEALLFAAATGHVAAPDTGAVKVTPRWGIHRSCGPAGLIHMAARDLFALTALHLSGGLAPDGTRLLSEASVAEMRMPQIALPQRWHYGTHWGLGWFLDDWGGHQVFGHDGGTLGQFAFLRVIPDSDLAVSLLTNGGRAPRRLYEELVGEIARELAGATLPVLPAAVDGPVDISEHVGTYSRTGVTMSVTQQADGTATITTTVDNAISSGQPPRVLTLCRSEDDVLLARDSGDGSCLPVVFLVLDGEHYLHLSARTTRRTR